MRLRRLLVLSIAWAIGCVHTQHHYDYASEPDPRRQEYIIGASDVLRISVWHNPDLSGDTVVRPDGTITLPLIGDLRAAGRTSEQIRVELTQRLGAFIKDESAIATIAVTGINSYRFTVSGNVEHPGTFVSTHYVTVLEAMTLAGGPNRFATPEDHGHHAHRGQARPTPHPHRLHRGAERQPPRAGSAAHLGRYHLRSVA